MGAVLEQKQNIGIFAPIKYWSSEYCQYYKNYSIGEKEALACVAAVSYFRKYLIGRKFKLQTNH